MSKALVCDQCGETLTVNGRGESATGEEAGWLVISGTWLRADLCTRACAIDYLNDPDFVEAHDAELGGDHWKSQGSSVTRTMIERASDPMNARDVVFDAVARHARSFVDGNKCSCGFERTSVVEPGTYREHLTDAVVADLAERGFQVVKLQQVGEYCEGVHEHPSTCPDVPPRVQEIQCFTTTQQPRRDRCPSAVPAYVIKDET